MSKKLVLIYRIAVALVVLAAVGVQFAHGARSNSFNPVNFFSFFTIESNIFGAVVLLVSAFVRSKNLDYIRGAATLYMLVTGVVYAILLSGADVQTPIPWVNAVLHYVFPVAILADWLVNRPRTRLMVMRALWWLAFPFAYIVYSLIRGHFAHWYPYPFINVDKLGYATVAVNSIVVAAGIVLVLLFVAKVSPRRT